MIRCEQISHCERKIPRYRENISAVYKMRENNAYMEDLLRIGRAEVMSNDHHTLNAALRIRMLQEQTTGSSKVHEFNWRTRMQVCFGQVVPLCREVQRFDARAVSAALRCILLNAATFQKSNFETRQSKNGKNAAHQIASFMSRAATKLLPLL
jgi:hypothetical protein